MLDLSKRINKIGASEVNFLFRKRANKVWLYNKIHKIYTQMSDFGIMCCQHGKKYELLCDFELKQFDGLKLQAMGYYPLYHGILTCTADYYFEDLNLLVELKCPKVRHLTDGGVIKFNYLMQCIQQSIIFKADCILWEVKVKDYDKFDSGYVIFYSKARLIEYTPDLEYRYIRLLESKLLCYDKFFSLVSDDNELFETLYDEYIVDQTFM